MDKKMATDKTPAQAQNDGWTVVSEATSAPETKIVMDNDGDQFTGTYLGMREIQGEGKPYQRHDSTFRKLALAS
jgi:hypothetical protein